MGKNPTLGESLRRAREQRGLTLEQIAFTTKLPKRHLDALERDDLAVVPGGMYLRAEIRAYADAVGLSRDVALGWLQAAIEPSPAAPSAAVATPAPATPRPSHWRATMVGLCAVLAGLALWIAIRESGATSPARVDSPTSAAVERATTPAANHATDASVTRTSASSDVAGERATATSGVTAAATSAAPQEHVTEPAITAQQAPLEAELDIVTMPDGARVTVDGVSWGTTPVSIRYLQPGYKRLRVTRDGFVAEERTIEFAADRPRTTVRITLRPLE